MTTYNTGSPVPSIDPRDLRDNSETLDEVVNSTALTADKRTGGTVKTLAGYDSEISARITNAIANYATLTNRGAWVAATAYNEGDLWSNSGTWYLVLVDYTSGASAAADIANGDAVEYTNVNRVQSVTSIADMKSAPKLYAGQSFDLSAGGRSGVFEWLEGDYSAEIAADTLEGIYVADATIPATTGALIRRLNGHVTPDMFGADPSGGSDCSGVFNAVKTLGLSMKSGSRSAIYLFSSDVELLEFDGLGCTLKTINCSIRMKKATGDNKNTTVQNFQIDDTGTTVAGDGCFIMEKGDMWRVKKIDARGLSGFGRKGLALRPFEDYAWLENLTFEHVKFSGFDYNRYVEIPNYIAVFINQINWINSEFRNSGVRGMTVDLSATTAAAQKASAWTFIGDEFDGGGQTDDDLIYLDTSGAAKVEAWTFIGCALEDTTTNHASGYCINSNDWTNVNGLNFINCPRYNFAAYVPAGADVQLLNTFDAQSPNCSGWEIDSPEITDPIVTDPTITGIVSAYTGATSGNSAFTAGQTKTAVTLPNTSAYRVYEVYVHPADAGSNTAAQKTTVICGPGGAATIDNDTSSQFSSSISGDDVQYTNNDSVTYNVRFTWVYVRGE